MRRHPRPTVAALPAALPAALLAVLGVVSTGGLAWAAGPAAAPAVARRNPSATVAASRTAPASSAARAARPAVGAPHAAPSWVDAWGAAPQSSAGAAGTDVGGQTVRMVVHLHAGGTRVRVQLSNAFGDRAVTFGRVTAGVRTAGAGVTSPRQVRFRGTSRVTVARGREVTSDPLALRVSRGQDLTVSMYLPAATGPATWHRAAFQIGYLSGPGDHGGDPGAAAFTGTVASWFFLDAVGVSGGGTPATIVALGDSITDGTGTPADTNSRWPDALSARLAAAGRAAPSVVDEGIAGNRMVTDDPVNGVSAEHRLSRDVLARAGVRYVVLLEGVNDLRSRAKPATAADVIAGYRRIISRVHAAHLRIYAGTLTPFAGSSPYSPAMETSRQRINDWIRTGGAFDSVIDFAAAVQDPADPRRLSTADDCGDHLHPNAAGYRAMANAVPLSLFS